MGIWNPKFSNQASYRAPERFQTRDVPHEEYRTLYLFCRRQESCHRRRFLEQFLSLFRGGLSQFWWNIFCFFIWLRWVLVTIFNWKRHTIQRFTIKRHALSTWTTFGYVHRSILRHYSTKLHTCSIFLQFFKKFFLFCLYFGWHRLVLQRFSN